MLIPGEYAGDMRELEGDPVAGLALLKDLVKDWHPDVRALFDEADAGNSGTGALKISDPVRPWPTRAVTLLGDAAHPAPPGGLGANMAFIDGELLCRKLVDPRPRGLRAADVYVRGGSPRLRGEGLRNVRRAEARGPARRPHGGQVNRGQDSVVLAPISVAHAVTARAAPASGASGWVRRTPSSPGH